MGSDDEQAGKREGAVKRAPVARPVR